MKHYVYRPVATQDVDPEFEWSYGFAEGENVGGRQVGYFSRSSAVRAGEGSGAPYRIERSNPITFGEQPLTEEQRAVATQARLGAALAELVLSGDAAAATQIAKAMTR